MIKAIILDVDGVLKGSKEGVNYPIPHQSVINALKDIHKKGIPVILCTGNYYYSIIDIITLANLRNPHITDRGALVVNPLENKVIEKHIIEKNLVVRIIEALLPLQNYLEVYSDHHYYVWKNQVTEFTKKRAIILRQDPIIIDSLIKDTQSQDILKINAFAMNAEEKQNITKTIEPFQNTVSMAFTGNPSIGTIEVANITAKGITKLHAAQLILNLLKIPFDSVLGAGDSVSDWDFMSKCKYAAAMGNAANELKELVKTKGEGNYFIAPHVDKNGILDVFRYFKIL